MLGGFRWDVRQKSFPVRVLRPWHRVPREAGAAPSLEVFAQEVPHPAIPLLVPRSSHDGFSQPNRENPARG